MRVKDAGCLSLNKVPEEGGLAESRLPVDFVRNSLEAIYPCCVRVTLAHTQPKIKSISRKCLSQSCLRLRLILQSARPFLPHALLHLCLLSLFASGSSFLSPCQRG